MVGEIFLDKHKKKKKMKLIKIKLKFKLIKLLEDIKKKWKC